MTYALGKKSLFNLEGVRDDLVRVVKLAITLTGQDFGVYEGLRSQARQDEYFKRGVTRVRSSKHQRQQDGFGHAVDLVPWIDGAMRWEWPPIYTIAAAMRDAAHQLEVQIRWGGVWDQRLNALEPGAENMRIAVAAYCVRHPGPDFIDGPHYELV